jgi:hypothetical protein
MGTCYVNICVAFKAVVMAFSYAWRVVPSIYRWVITNLKGDWLFIIIVRSCVPLGS